MKHRLNRFLSRASISRRRLMQGSVAVAAAGALPRASFGGVDLRRELLRIPGLDAGPPCEADWRRVGALCLGGTRATARAGEFRGVGLTFAGLATHNALFRGQLRPWEEYTGARVDWLDLFRAEDVVPLLRSSAAGADIVEMDGPFEGELLGGGLASEMPGWVQGLVDVGDYVDCLRAPVGTWEKRRYRVVIDGSCHVLNHRTDYFEDEGLARAWRDGGHEGPWEVPVTWDRVAEVTAFLAGRADPAGRPAYGVLEPLRGWSGFGFHFLVDRAAAYGKYPGDPALLFEPATMAPLINTPPWLRAIEDVAAMIPHMPPGQVRADPGTTGIQQFLAGTGALVAWWGDLGDTARTSGTTPGAIGFGVLPGAREVWNRRTGVWEAPERPNVAPNIAGIGWGLYVMAGVDGDPVRRKAAWSAAAHLGGKDLSLWNCCYPSGFQPHRTSHFDAEEWVAAGYEEGFATAYLASQRDSYNHPNAVVEPRIPGIFRYYSAAEDGLARIYGGRCGSVRDGADAIAIAWDEITDELGRAGQISLYRASLGL